MSKFTKYLASIAVILCTSLAFANSEDGIVAYLGTLKAPQGKGYTDLATALSDLAAATKEENYLLTLDDDINLSSGLTFQAGENATHDVPYTGDHARPEMYQINFAEHTVTVNYESDEADYALKIIHPETDTLCPMIRIYGGTIAATGKTHGALTSNSRSMLHIVNMTLTSNNDAHYTCYLGVNGYNDLLKGCTVTNAGKGGAISFNGIQGFVHSSTVTCVYGIAVYANAGDEDSGGVACSASTITGETALYVADNENVKPVYITGGVITGAIPNQDNLTACGGTFNIDPSTIVGEDSGYWIEHEEGSTVWIVKDDKAVQWKIGDGEWTQSDIRSAFAKTDDNLTIQLNGDIFLLALEAQTYLFDLNKSRSLTVDLNGHTLNVFDVSASFSNVSFANVSGGGNLTFTNSKPDEGGYLSFAAWLMDYRNVPGWRNNMITIGQGGTLTLDVGTNGMLENLSGSICGFNVATYVVDHSGGTFNLKSGTLADAGGTAIRMFNTYTMDFNMTGGSVLAGYCPLWFNGVKDAHVTISGGEMICTDTDNGYLMYNSFAKAGDQSTVIFKDDCYAEGWIYALSGSPVNFIQIKGGTFGGDGCLYGPYTRDSIVVSGGVVDPVYLYYYNRYKFSETPNKYLTVVETTGSELMINEDDQYCFGAPTAYLTSPVLVTSEDNVAVNSSSLLYDKFASATKAMEWVGSMKYIMGGTYRTIARDVTLVADDNVSQSHTFANPFAYLSAMNTCSFNLNSHNICSNTEDPLFIIEDAGSAGAKIEVHGSGSITTDGSVFATEELSDSWVEIYSGDYTTKGTDLFSGEVYVMADVGDGSYFDVNPASFSHDVSDFIYNEEDNIAFKTINPMTERYYLGRVVEVEDAPQK